MRINIGEDLAIQLLSPYLWYISSAFLSIQHYCGTFTYIEVKRKWHRYAKKIAVTQRYRPTPYRHLAYMGISGKSASGDS
jgi:hypothetical protein